MVFFDRKDGNGRKRLARVGVMGTSHAFCKLVFPHGYCKLSPTGAHEVMLWLRMLALVPSDVDIFLETWLKPYSSILAMVITTHTRLWTANGNPYSHKACQLLRPE